jgi:hypothetical protein
MRRTEAVLGYTGSGGETADGDCSDFEDIAGNSPTKRDPEL